MKVTECLQFDSPKAFRRTQNTNRRKNTDTMNKLKYSLQQNLILILIYRMYLIWMVKFNFEIIGRIG